MTLGFRTVDQTEREQATRGPSGSGLTSGRHTQRCIPENIGVEEPLRCLGAHEVVRVNRDNRHQCGVQAVPDAERDRSDSPRKRAEKGQPGKGDRGARHRERVGRRLSGISVLKERNAALLGGPRTSRRDVGRVLLRYTRVETLRSRPGCRRRVSLTDPIQVLNPSSRGSSKPRRWRRAPRGPHRPDTGRTRSLPGGPRRRTQARRSASSLADRSGSSRSP